MPHVHFDGAGGNIGAGKCNDGCPREPPDPGRPRRRRDGPGLGGDPEDADRGRRRRLGVGRRGAAGRAAPRRGPAPRRSGRPGGDGRVRGPRPPTTWSGSAAARRATRSTSPACGSGRARVLHMPGELFVEYQLAAQKLRPDLFVAMAAYGDYGPGYIGTEVAYPQGGYETSPVVARRAGVERVLTEPSEVCSATEARAVQPLPGRFAARIMAGGESDHSWKMGSLESISAWPPISTANESSNGRIDPANRSSHEHANGSAALLAGVRDGRRAAGPGRPGLPVPTPAGLGRRGDPRPEGGAAPARDRAPRPPAGGDPARAAAGGGGRAGAEGHCATATCWRRCLLAGVRNVQPRPSVGHKFHAVLVVNSAHLASLASPDTDRWLPIFWALDYFKSSQAQDVREGNWTMGPVDESAVPPARKAREAFAAAMDDWDEAAADAAVASPGPLGRGQRGLRAVLPLRRPRLPLDRPQGDLRGQQLADAPVHRLAARRAGPAVAGLRPADARGRQPRPARRPGRPPLAAQPGARGPDQGGLDRGQARRGGLGRPARHARARAPTTTPATRWSSCSTAGSPRSRSGTPCSTAPASCCSASRGSSRCTR